MADRDLSMSRAILIGNSTYHPESGIPDLPAAASCVPAMAELLAGDLCGWSTERIVALIDVASPPELARRILAATRGVQDTVLLYYVGHGLRTYEGHLALALADSDSDPEALPHTAMLYEAIAKILRGCAARTKLVILDCCHAELGTRANYVFQSAGDLAEEYPVDGLYFIGASMTHQRAKAPVVGDLTYFTQALLGTVRDGIPGLPAMLRLDQIFLELRSRLLRGNLPVPVESSTRGARQYPFARNAAWAERDLEDENAPLPEPSAAACPPTAPAPAATADPELCRRIIAVAEQISHSSTGDPALRADVLERMARTVATTDPDRSLMLLTEAEQAARSISGDPVGQAHLLGQIARTVAASDPDRSLMILTEAEQVARGIAAEPLSQHIKAGALCDVAEWLVAVDPSRSRGILADAVPLAGRSFSPARSATELGRIAHALAAVDPAGSRELFADVERIARSITDPGTRASTLGHLAERLADTDPDHAEKIASSITDPFSQAGALRGIARALAASDPGRSRRILADAGLAAHNISDPWGMAIELSQIARALAATDPRGSRRILVEAEMAVRRGLSDPRERADEIRRLARALASTDSGRSRKMLVDAEQIARGITHPGDRDNALRDITETLADIDPERAEQIARSIIDPCSQAGALTGVAKALAVTKPDRSRHILAEAEQIANRITDLGSQAIELSWIAYALTDTDPDRAEQIARSIDPAHRAAALYHIALTIIDGNADGSDE